MTLQVALMLGCWAIAEHKTIKGRDTKGSTDTISYPISSHPGFSVKASDCLQQILCRAAKLLGAAQERGSTEGVPSRWKLTCCLAASAQPSSAQLRSIVSLFSLRPVGEKVNLSFFVAAIQCPHPSEWSSSQFGFVPCSSLPTFSFWSTPVWVFLSSVSKKTLKGKCRRSGETLQSHRGIQDCKSSNREVIVNSQASRILFLVVILSAQ